MAAVALIILAEKTLPWPAFVRYATARRACALWCAGDCVTPTFPFQKDGSAAMPAEMQMKMPGSRSALAMK